MYSISPIGRIENSFVFDYQKKEEKSSRRKKQNEVFDLGEEMRLTKNNL